MLWKYFVETGFFIGLLANALLFVPQAIKLYRTKDARGISLVTFAGFNLIQLFIFLHGILNRDYALSIGYFLSLITCGAVTGMIILYRNK